MRSQVVLQADWAWYLAARSLPVSVARLAGWPPRGDPFTCQAVSGPGRRPGRGRAGEVR